MNPRDALAEGGLAPIPCQIVGIMPTSLDGDRYVDGSLLIRAGGSEFGAMAGGFFAARKMTREQLANYVHKRATGRLHFSLIYDTVAKIGSGMLAVEPVKQNSSWVHMYGRVTGVERRTVPGAGGEPRHVRAVHIDVGFPATIECREQTSVEVGDHVVADAYAILSEVHVLDDPYPFVIQQPESARDDVVRP